MKQVDRLPLQTAKTFITLIILTLAHDLSLCCTGLNCHSEWSMTE